VGNPHHQQEQVVAKSAVIFWIFFKTGVNHACRDFNLKECPAGLNLN
jgi:hypothetical protein